MLHSQVPKYLFASLLLTSLCLAEESCCCGYGFTVSGSALFWQPHEDGFDYVIENEAGTAFANNNAHVERVEFDWSWGFRIALDYQIPCQMNLTALWTRFEGHGAHHSTAPALGALFQVWTIPGSGLSYARSASAHWNSCFNMVDLRASTLFTPCCFLELTPYVALSTTWIDQKFHINSNGGTNTQIANAIVLSDKIEMKNDFWGIGPKVGLLTNWDLFCGISFYASFDAALFYGCFNIHQSEVVELTNLNTPITYLDIGHNKYWQSRVGLDFDFGLAWDMTFCNDCFGLNIQAGWENLYFFGQNQLMRFQTVSHPGINSSNQGDLSYQGLTLKASVSF